jgi:DNA-binding NarL/FixJ family response regulator
VAWPSLVAGRWSLVEHFDSSHQRFLVAVVNPPERHASLALPAREAAVAELVGQGHSQKFVAYELGLQRSEVSRSLRSALSRLGLARESDLVALVGTSGARSVDPPHTGGHATSRVHAQEGSQALA